MDNPGFLIEEIEPGVESGIRNKMAEMSWKLETPGFEFGTEDVDNLITPD